MKKCLAIVAIVALGGGLALADVVGSDHDLSTGSGTTGAATNLDEVCAFCHTPHQPTGTTQVPLWNHNLPATTTYDIYWSDTIDGYDQAAATAKDLAGSISLLCMSCHDGSVGLGSLINPPPTSDGNPISNASTNISGNANLGTDLSNDHPVGIDYAASISGGDSELVATGSLPAGTLFNGLVECASCHDPHNTTFAPFLVKSNADSAICTTCHVK